MTTNTGARLARNSPRQRGKPRKPAWPWVLLGCSIPFVCAAVLGLALYRAGYLPNVFSPNLTATAIAQNNASCQALIERAMQASGSFCGQVGSNKVCYGNILLQADLVPDTVQRFSERGDIIEVNTLRRLSASPLNIASDEWGIAIFKVMANLPRSLPGQTISMIVFGNTSLDNTSGNLESFYFSSELGRIVCENVPNDGIIITVPDGDGVQFMVNGAEVTLMGDASLRATKNGTMEVSLYSGAGRIVSDGQEQYFGAGQEVSVPLGGENGNEAVGPPSPPEALSEDDLNTACALLTHYCSPDEIVPVPGAQAQQQIQAGLGITPTHTPTSTFTATRTRTPTITPTGTILAIPSWTPSKTPTRTPTRTRTPVNTPTRTRTPSRTPTRTRTPTPSRTPTRTSTPATTSTYTATVTATASYTATLIPTDTLTPTITFTPTDTLTPTATFTPTDTEVPTATNTPLSDPICTGSEVVPGVLSDSGTSLLLGLTNNTAGIVIIDALQINWNTGTATRILDQFLDGNLIGNANELTSPSDFPSPNPFNGPLAFREIGAGATETLTVNFQNPPTGGGYTVAIHFDIGCQVSGSK